MAIPTLGTKDLADVANAKQDKILTDLSEKDKVVVAHGDGGIDAISYELSGDLDNSDRKIPLSRTVYQNILAESTYRQNADADLEAKIDAIPGLTWSDYFTPVNANIEAQDGAAMYRAGGDARLRLPFLNNQSAFSSNTTVFNAAAGKITTPNLGTFYGSLYTTNGILAGSCWIQGNNNALVIAPLPGTSIAANTGLVLDIRFPL
jgi:hypothetical protein